MKFFFLVIALIFTGCAGAQKSNSAGAEKKPAPSATAQKSDTSAPAKASTDSKAAMNAKKDNPVLKCSNGGDARTLEVVSKDKGCALNYTKAGKSSEVASAKHGPKHCDESKDKIRKKLESAGFKCE